MRYKNEVLTRIESLETQIDYTVKSMHTGQATGKSVTEELKTIQKKIKAIKNFLELESTV